MVVHIDIQNLNVDFLAFFEIGGDGLDPLVGDFRNVHQTFDARLELDDEANGCLAVAANSAQNLGQTDKHASYITRYQELNPDDPTVLFNEAAVFLNNLDDDGARPLLEKCRERFLGFR